jgi:hypothetical protein
MSVLLLLKGQMIPWVMVVMYTNSLCRLRLTSQCIRDIFSIAQSESNARTSRYSSADIRRLLLQHYNSGVVVLECSAAKSRLRRAMRLKLGRRNISDF